LINFNAFSYRTAARFSIVNVPTPPPVGVQKSESLFGITVHSNESFFLIGFKCTKFFQKKQAFFSFSQKYFTFGTSTVVSFEKLNGGKLF